MAFSWAQDFLPKEYMIPTMGSKYEILSTEVDLNFPLKLRTPENKKEFYKI